MLSALRGLAPCEGLESLLVKMGRTGPLAEPRHGPQAGKSGDSHSQNTDKPHTRTAAMRRHKGNTAQLEDAAPHEEDGNLDEDGCRAQRQPAGHNHDEQQM